MPKHYNENKFKHTISIIHGNDIQEQILVEILKIKFFQFLQSEPLVHQPYPKNNQVCVTIRSPTKLKFSECCKCVLKSSFEIR